MLSDLYAKPGFQQFYESDLPRICLWVGLIASIGYFFVFLLPLFSSGVPDLSILHPFKSEFLTGLCLIVLSLALKRQSVAVPTLFTVLAVLVVAQYFRVSGAAEGISGPFPISFVGYFVVTLELLAILVFYIYSVKRIRDSNGPD